MRRNSLQGNLYYSGNSDFGKEQSHENGFVSTDIKINVTSLLKGKWIGFKFIIYITYLQLRIALCL
jgi:hypothetical protein